MKKLAFLLIALPFFKFDATVQMYATGDNPNTGAMPTVNFEDPSNGNILYYKQLTSSFGTINVPVATYNIVITETNNHSFSASIPGYGSRMGQTLTFDSVAVTNMSIYITCN